MVKKCTSLLLCLVFAYSAFSQTDFHFADTTAQWNVIAATLQYDTPPYYVYSTTIYKLAGDTIINSLSYQIIQNAVGSYPGEYYLRRDSLNRVYNYFNSIDNLIYDFNKQVGDTFIMYQDTVYPYQGGTTVTVTAVDTVFWDRPRKRMLICMGDTPIVQYSVVVIDGIGMLGDNFLFPLYPHIPETSNETLCFFDYDSLVYHDTTFASCYIETGVNELAQFDTKVYPNPASENYVNIQLNQNSSQSVNFALYDITGRMILQKPLSNQTSHVDLGNISPGIYLYSISSQQLQIGTGKLIVE